MNAFVDSILLAGCGVMDVPSSDKEAHCNGEVPRRCNGRKVHPLCQSMATGKDDDDGPVLM